MRGAKNGKLHIINGDYFNEYIKAKVEGLREIFFLQAPNLVDK